MSSTTPLFPPDIDKGTGILAVTWTEAAIGLIVLAARLYTRARIVRNVGWDDWTMVLATILALITSALVHKEVDYGVGRHAVYILPPTNLIEAVKMIWLTTPFSTMSACFGKISIALLLLRMINRNKMQQAFLWCLIVSLFIVNLILTIVTFAQCRPVYYLWDQLNPMIDYRGTCWDTRVQKYYGYFQGAFSSFSDLVLALFPILIIRNLQMELRLKIALAIVMGLGIIATVASVIKTVELRNLATPDFTWNATSLVYWYITENWLIIIAACIPTLAPLYFVLLGKRTKESFQVQGQDGSRTPSWLRTWSWKWTRISGNSGGSGSGGSRQSKIKHGTWNPSPDSSYGRGVMDADEQSETELMPTNPAIKKTTELSTAVSPAV